MISKIVKRPYKNQKQKDLELVQAYQNGLNHGRKEIVEKLNKELTKENYIKRKPEFCFCMGEPVWRPICSVCQKWFKEDLLRRIKILKDKSKGKIIEGTWAGIGESILEINYSLTREGVK